MGGLDRLLARRPRRRERRSARPDSHCRLLRPIRGERFGGLDAKWRACGARFLPARPRVADGLARLAGVALLAVPLLGVVVAATAAAVDGHTLGFQMGWREAPYVYLWLLILGGPLAEEFGWSYLSDRLDERLPALPANLLLGIVWACWHLPLFFLAVPGLSQTFIPFPVFLVTAVCLRFLFAWGYHLGGRNILANLLAHNGLNFAVSLVLIVIPAPGNPQWRLLALGLLTGMLAALLYRFVPPAAKPPRLQAVSAASGGV